MRDIKTIKNERFHELLNMENMFTEFAAVAATEGYSSEESKLIYYNKHNVGKYIVAETREGSKNRLFVRHPGTVFKDTATKAGWWDLFTLKDSKCDEEVEEASVYICEITRYAIDRSGHCIQAVKPKYKMPEFSNCFWGSRLHQFVMTRCLGEKFMREFHFTSYANYNVDALEEKYPKVALDPSKDVFKELQRVGEYLLKEVSRRVGFAAKAEAALMEPTEVEQLIINWTQSANSGNWDQFVAYAHLRRKLKTMSANHNYKSEEQLQYIRRLELKYDELVKDETIVPIPTGKRGEPAVAPVLNLVCKYYYADGAAKKAVRDAKKKAKKTGEVVNEPKLYMSVFSSMMEEE